jgi:hypothetical protein
MKNINPRMVHLVILVMIIQWLHVRDAPSESGSGVPPASQLTQPHSLLAPAPSNPLARDESDQSADQSGWSIGGPEPARDLAPASDAAGADAVPSRWDEPIGGTRVATYCIIADEAFVLGVLILNGTRFASAGPGEVPEQAGLEDMIAPASGPFVEHPERAPDAVALAGIGPLGRPVQ